MKKKIILLSGVAAGHSGSARLIAQWQELAKARSDHSDTKIDFIYGKEGTGHPWRWIRYGEYLKALQSPVHRMIGAFRIKRALKSSEALNPDNAVLIYHPQGIGLHQTLEFIRRRNAPVWMYLLDNSFFCVKSYNHIEDEHQACLRCLQSQHDYPKEFGCHPYSGTTGAHHKYLKEILALSACGKIRFMTQCDSQAALARRQFGAEAKIYTVGIWGDWDVDEEAPPMANMKPDKYDVVFHGNCRHAKGAYWAIDIARSCPEKQFLFPFHVKETLLPADQMPSNCNFIPMSWERGLREHLIAARVVLAPSLWSAPVEGALVKSLALGCAVATVNQDTGFASELPSSVIIRLPPDPKDAANSLNTLTTHEIEVLKSSARKWAREFREKNMDAFSRIVALCVAEDSE